MAEPSRSTLAHPSPLRSRLALLGAVGFILVMVATGGLAMVTNQAVPVVSGTSFGHGASLSVASPAVSSEAATPGAAAPATALSLSSGVTPSAICGLGSVDCNVGVPNARLTLSALVTSSAKAFYPDVQVAFVLETTGPDGDEDHYNSYFGSDPCATASSGQGPLCEESNGVPFMIANGQAIANAIQSANPHSNVTFAMTDFYGTDYDWNDGPFDSWKYHVDIPQFIPSAEFGAAVHQTFQAQEMDEANGWGCICGLDDNFLHSSAITGLYGTIIGSGLDWSANTHHVIVAMMSAAPRDPNYVENYWVSAFDHCCTSPSPYGGTCEPSYTFSNGVSPACEGWVKSQDGNVNDSIAALTRTAPSCTDSIGHVCTVDVIDYWDTPTDPYSQGWPTNPGYPSGSSGAGPGGSGVITDSAHILEAGCDLAAATGGSWNGPAYWTCPSGQSGSLQYVAHGPLSTPNTANPTLFSAVRAIGFGPVYQTLVANGSNQPVFTWVPPPNFAVSTDPQYTAACTTPSGFLPTCQTQPFLIKKNGISYLGWNWSTNKSANKMYVGDAWTASFNIVNTGPPYELDPVLECVTDACRAVGAGAIAGLYSWAAYYPANSTAVTTLSFPLAETHVLGPQGIAPPPSVVPPPPPVPPGIPIISVAPQPVLVPTPNILGQGIAQFSLQATAAGFLGAGFMRVGMKNRPLAVGVAQKNAALLRRQHEDNLHLGKFQ